MKRIVCSLLVAALPFGSVVTTYTAGQSFSEVPGDRHHVSSNASETKPAKLLAVFVVDTNETELTIPFGN
jgi:quercetin dioxygenase-like cupin family protein